MSKYSGKYLKITQVPDSTGVLLVEFARPPANAFSTPMWEELGSTFDKISKDGDVRSVVLASSTPKFWTAGLDLVAVAEGPVTAPTNDFSRKSMIIANHLTDFQAAITTIERCRQPVIAAVHGFAIGLAVDILCACDIRYAAENSVFSIKEVDVGMAADIGTLARIGKIVSSESAVRELAFTSKNFGATEAFNLGFVSKVVKGGRDQVIDAALGTAKVIASKSPVGVMGTKHLMIHARDHSVPENLAYTAVWNGTMLQADDFKKSAEAFTTKKPAVFKPLPKL